MELEAVLKKLLDAGKRTDQIESQVRAILATLVHEGFNENDLDLRDYTYVVVYVKDLTREYGKRRETFLVTSPFKTQATHLAFKYASLKKWEIIPQDHNGKGLQNFEMYHRKYIREARKLFGLNKYI